VLIIESINIVCSLTLASQHPPTTREWSERHGCKYQCKIILECIFGGAMVQNLVYTHTVLCTFIKTTRKTVALKANVHALRLGEHRL
jgi:hypothetical protein